MILKYSKLAFLYFIGTIFWLILFSVLQAQCIVNIPLFIDGLWSKERNEYFVENLIGSIAYRTRGFGCENTLIYIVKFYQDDASGDYEIKTLTELVDVDSWKKISSDNISATYADNRHRYVLYNTSDGIYMSAFNK